MFDSLAFLNANFNTPSGVVGLLAKHGFETPQLDTARKWFARGSIPSEWWPIVIIVAFAEAHGSLNLRAYVKGGGPRDIFA